MKKELVVSMLLVLAFLFFVNLFMFTPIVQAQASEPTVIGSMDVFGYSYQRYTFYANARFWAFYSDNTNIVYKTSTDGSTWSSATTVRAASMSPEFSVWFDGTYVHYAKGQKDQVPNTPLYYRMGVPNANGTITWTATEQTVAPAVENRSYRAPQIITDSDGYPVITYLDKSTSPTVYSVSVAKSSTKNGTWTNATGFPVVVSTDPGWPFSVPLTNGKLYTMWSLDHGKIKGALYNGTDWESAENSTSNFIGEDQYGNSAVAYGDDVHLVYIGNETATKIYRYVKRTYGSGWGSETVVKNVTGASGDYRSISLTVNPSNGDLWMWFNTTDNRIAYRKYVASTSSWDTNDTYPFGASFTSPYYITTSYQVRNNKIPTYWQEGTTTPYDLVFDYLTIDTVPPNIAILSPENKTYATSSVPLNFTVDEATSWMGYSLDSQMNVTITGNSTLTSLLDGSHYVVVYANDTAGNMGASSKVYFTIDMTSSTTTDNYDGLWRNTDFAITLTATDDISGVAEIYYKINDGPTQNVSANGQPFITTESANNTLEYWSVDEVGNEEKPHNVLTDIKLDKTAPTTTISLSDSLGTNGWYTSNVTVTLSGTDSTSGIDKTEYNFDNATWITYTTPFTIANEETTTIYYKSTDKAGNVETTKSQTMKIDKTVPSGSIIINDGDAYTTSTSVTLTLSATDATSGVAEMRFSNDNVTYTDWQTYASSKSWGLQEGDGAKTVYVQIRDHAGLISTYSDIIILDTTKPTGSVTIAGGTPYTNSPSVTLTPSADDTISGVAQMRFGNDGTTWSDWEAYATSKSWTLPSSDGTKTVYVQYRDDAGLVSSSYSDTITLDTAPPTITITSPSNGSEIRSSSLTINWAGTDAGSGIDHYEVRLDDDAWINVGTDTTYTFTGIGDGSHRVDVKTIDKTNKSQVSSVNVIVNTSLIGGPGYIEEAALGAVIVLAALGTAIYLLKIRKRT